MGLEIGKYKAFDGLGYWRKKRYGAVGCAEGGLFIGFEDRDGIGILPDLRYVIGLNGCVDDVGEELEGDGADVLEVSHGDVIWTYCG